MREMIYLSFPGPVMIVSFRSPLAVRRLVVRRFVQFILAEVLT